MGYIFCNVKQEIGLRHNKFYENDNHNKKFIQKISVGYSQHVTIQKYNTLEQ